MNLALLVLRLALGGIFLYHGLAKRGMWKVKPSEETPASMLATMRILSIVEPLAGLALVLGFLTRLGALAVVIIMLGALWLKITKWRVPFSATNQTGWEFDLVNLAAAFALLALAGGAYSVDALILRLL
jgi:putative oxidoreductase